MKRVIKGAIVFMLLYFCIMGNQQTIHAETVDVQNEYLQKKSAGREVYEITSQSGKFMGYYEPSFLENLDIMPRTRVRYNVGNWTISANTTSWTTTIHSWIKGDKITVNDDGTVGIVNGSYSTNGWVNGTITVGYTGHFNFLIQNASNHSIVYSGNYIY